jgi:hypothetical protein
VKHVFKGGERENLLPFSIMKLSLFFRVAVSISPLWLAYACQSAPAGQGAKALPAEAAISESEMGRVLDPSKPVLDLNPIVEEKCRARFDFTLDKRGIVKGNIYFAAADGALAKQTAKHVRQIYDFVALSAGRDIQVPMDVYLVPVKEIPLNFAFKKDHPQQGLVHALFVLEEKSGASPEDESGTAMLALLYRLIPHELAHMATADLFDESEWNANFSTRWIEDGFSEFVAAAVRKKYGIEDSPLLFREEILKLFNDENIRTTLWRWSTVQTTVHVESTKDGRDVSKDFWAAENKLYRASWAVFEALESIGGEGTVQKIILALQRQRPVKTEEVFSIIEKETGIDVRDWNGFTEKYKQFGAFR